MGVQTYTILKGALTFLDIANVPRPTQDPFWLCDYTTPLKKPKTICDVGSGIGTIACIQALKNPQAQVTGYEIDTNLLNIANHNAQYNKIGNLIFKPCNILIEKPKLKYDLVLSNPPYHNTEKGFKAKSTQKNLAHGASIQQMQQWLINCISLTQKGGTCTLIHHSHNLEYFTEILKVYDHSITYIETSPARPPKRFVLNIHP
tara:strand:+ start:100705 stop:101313 length:609 start_codon:yes stop_codon:yes gene_type:complete